MQDGSVLAHLWPHPQETGGRVQVTLRVILSFALGLALYSLYLSLCLGSLSGLPEYSIPTSYVGYYAGVVIFLQRWPDQPFGMTGSHTLASSLGYTRE